MSRPTRLPQRPRCELRGFCASNFRMVARAARSGFLSGRTWRSHCLLRRESRRVRPARRFRRRKCRRRRRIPRRRSTRGRPCAGPRRKGGLQAVHPLPLRQSRLNRVSRAQDAALLPQDPHPRLCGRGAGEGQRHGNSVPFRRKLLRHRARNGAGRPQQPNRRRKAPSIWMRREASNKISFWRGRNPTIG